ncbi:hypothetical protein [Pedobacter rhodius]|uniref:Uncharacterized protein n=1 Tax=Pedobacter rhodius TaxID=3004098 RepID=A0ABT4KW56_9SPHI|nr:hypothetical protein [Pedobacter sp. SJ11]MCZ4222467.1 hypothetical protein [Pedobacter sp. SJ11]
MRKYIIIILLCAFFTACKKDVPLPDVVRMDIYSSHIKHTNYNEPDTLFWYVWEANKGGYFYIATTSDVKNFSDYSFTYSKDLPKDIRGKLRIKEIVVWINQLNGDILSDITNKSASSPNVD